MSRKLLFADAVAGPGAAIGLHSELLAGVRQLALAVGSTLGPRGRNVILDRAGDPPIVTKDGVTVARNIHLTDPVQEAAVKLIQEVARDTVNAAGDGTTTATVLAWRIFEAGLALVGSGSNPIALQRSLTAVVADLADAIRRLAQPPTEQQIAQVAAISTNGNQAVADLILQAVTQVGREGVITLDDAKDAHTSLEVREGFQFESGWTHPSFVTDPAHGTAVLDNPLIFITERLLSQGITSVPTLHDLAPLMMLAAGLDTAGKAQIAEPRPLLVIADDIQGDALTSLIVNHQKGNVQVCAVRAPGFGEYKRAMLSDLALCTGGEVLTMDSGRAVSEWVFEGEGRGRQRSDKRLGRCRRAVIANGRTVLEGCDAGGDPALDVIRSYAASLRTQAAESQEPQTREHLYQRAARLTGKIAVIRVGAQTEPEARALRDSVEDAVLAVRAALSEGIVPGGGLCLFGLAQTLRNSLDSLPPGEAREAARLLAGCCEAPLRQIAANAGRDPDEIAAEVLREWAASGTLIGYDASADRLVDMVAQGIVDPARVVRVALEKAASIAALMLTSSCLVYFDPEAVRPAAQPAGFSQGARP